MAKSNGIQELQRSRFAMGTAIYRSLHTPEPRDFQKVSKRSSWASPPGVSTKVSKKSPNTDFDALLTLFWILWDFFRHFLTLRAGRPGKTATRLFWDFGARGCGDTIQNTREGCGCPRFLAGRVCWQISTLLENSSPIFRQHEVLSLPRFGHFPARKTAAGKLAAPSGTLLDFLLRDRHSLHFCFSPGKGKKL